MPEQTTDGPFNSSLGRPSHLTADHPVRLESTPSTFFVLVEHRLDCDATAIVAAGSIIREATSQSSKLRRYACGSGNYGNVSTQYRTLLSKLVS